MKIILDVQHMNKPHRPTDRGAGFSNITDRGVGYAMTEVDCVISYMNEARKLLEKAGHEVFFGLCGSYADRHRYINSYIKPDLYLAGHVNAGGGSYSLVEIDHRAGYRTKHIANLIVSLFEEHLETSAAKLWTLKKESRGFSCIKGIACSALLLEPLFIDNADHRDILRNKPELIGKCIDDAVEQWSVL